jgi:hypothetical protein
MSCRREGFHESRCVRDSGFAAQGLRRRCVYQQSGWEVVRWGPVLKPDVGEMLNTMGTGLISKIYRERESPRRVHRGCAEGLHSLTWCESCVVLMRGSLAGREVRVRAT